MKNAASRPGHEISFVIAGLDPAIHPLRKTLAKWMDTRVKPAYDAAYVAASRKISKFEFQTATASRPRAAARVGLLVDLPF
jgi:hypothetical protein